MGVTQGQPEKNARSWGVSRSVKGASGPLAPEQMACRKPIDGNRGLKGKREGEFRPGAVVCS